MSVRFSLVLIIVLSYASIGAALVVNRGFGDTTNEPDLPFFYTVSSEDLRTIAIRHGDVEQSWSQRVGERRWYFDGMQNIPADLNRWGGITTLVGGPKVARQLEEDIEDPALYGLDNPQTEITLTLRDGDTRTLQLGNLTPDGEANYARMVGFSQLVLVDYTWGQVLNRLVDEPPYPQWYYTLDPSQAREILFFKENEVVRAYGVNRDTGEWHLCDLPIVGDPCEGDTAADVDALMQELTYISDRQIEGAVELNLQDEESFAQYDAGVNSPYLAIRIEERQANGVTTVDRVTMTIGGVTPDGEGRYMVANETSDVIRVDRAWADHVLELFEGEPLLAGS
jgi:hypothetical protein